MPSGKDVSQALSRIQAVLTPKNQAGRASRDIRLGLERVARAAPEVQTWEGIHVGGTNGKGSICAFLSGLFTLAGVSYGRYVSPAFPSSRDGVVINGRPCKASLYNEEKATVAQHYERIMRGWRFATSEHPGELSPFELDTATAFKIFNMTNVKYGIVEVGMGGATDATNVMTRKAVTVISKIGLDHQEYLGRQLTDIAKVKAGIMRPGVPCVVDHTNSDDVMNVLREHARSIGAALVPTWRGEPLLATLDNARWQLEDYQKQNLLCAAMAFRYAFPHRAIDLNRLLEMEPYLPGRMDWVEVSGLTNGDYQAPVLVDAAHNLIGVQSLAKYVVKNLRNADEPVTWVIGLSSSETKPFDQIIQTLVRPNDNVAFVEFEQGENEPQPTPASMGRDILSNVVVSEKQIYDGEPRIRDAMQWAVSNAQNGPIVVTGSLYLTRDFFSLKGVRRLKLMDKTRAGSSELRRLSQLARHRLLTEKEFEQLETEKSYWRTSKAETAAEDPEYMDEEASSNLPDQTNGDEIGSTMTGTGTPDETISPSSEGPAANMDLRTKTPEELSAEASRLQYLTARHKRQFAGYRSALVGIKGDVDELSEDSSPLSDAQAREQGRLQEHMTFLQAQATKHFETAKRTEAQLTAIKDEITAREVAIPGKPGVPTATKNPFFEPQELGPGKKKGRQQPPKREEKKIKERTPNEIAVKERKKMYKDFWGREVPDEEKL